MSEIKVCLNVTMSESGLSHLVLKCKRIYQRYGLDIEIPTDYAYDPVEVFDEVDVRANVFRFAVYVLWLDAQPDAFSKYLPIRDCRRDLWKDNVYKVYLL